MCLCGNLALSKNNNKPKQQNTKPYGASRSNDQITENARGKWRQEEAGYRTVPGGHVSHPPTPAASDLGERNMVGEHVKAILPEEGGWQRLIEPWWMSIILSGRLRQEEWSKQSLGEVKRLKYLRGVSIWSCLISKANIPRTFNPPHFSKDAGPGPGEEDRRAGGNIEEALGLRCLPCTCRSLGVRAAFHFAPWAPFLPDPGPWPFRYLPLSYPWTPEVKPERTIERAAIFHALDAVLLLILSDLLLLVS